MTLNADDLLLYIDSTLLVINKPAGLTTLPDGFDPAAAHVKSLLEPLYGRLWIVHRLDRDTSGVLVLARSAAAHRALNTQFEQRETAKIYHALVIGCPPWETALADTPLRTNVGHKHRTVADAQRGKAAITTFEVIRRFAAATLLAACPHTGRTHQIRAHLALLGFPLVGDTLYGGAPAFGLSRSALHAHSLEITHPLDGRTLRFEAPYPADLSAALQAARHSTIP